MQLPVKVFDSGKVVADADGNVSFTAEWKNAKIWDVHTPHNRYVCRMELRDESGRLLDAQLPFGFGFRDVRIKARELFLNGKPLHLRVLRNTTMNSPAGVACRTAALEMVRRLKSLGFNAIINGNYDFSPGEVSYMEGLLEACDETGMIVSFSLPHVRDVDMKIEEPRNASRYRNLTKWVMSRARNHPSVILYAMNHNYAGYAGDMNPLRIDGRYDLVQEDGDRRLTAALDSRRRAHAAYQIAKSLDSTRPIYHH
jgi:beta-galactosidase/beta-glucuronidase